MDIRLAGPMAVASSFTKTAISILFLSVLKDVAFLGRGLWCDRACFRPWRDVPVVGIGVGGPVVNCHHSCSYVSIRGNGYAPFSPRDANLTATTLTTSFILSPCSDR